VHCLAVAISIRTNGNALRLLVQVHGLLQRDDCKEGGIERGGVPGMAIAVLMLQAIFWDASGVY
jgi:hypothetical protein